jgi:KaiC/GvpD/RAD55 family RecA-like ATPase
MRKTSKKIFLVKGALQYNEPGVFVSFEEESKEELYEDVLALNLDLKKLVFQKKIVVKHIVLERRDVGESVSDLNGILVRLEQAIESIRGKKGCTRYDRISLRRPQQYWHLSCGAEETVSMA